MSAIAAGIAPIFLLVAFGFLLRRREVFGREFWDQVERLVFYFLFPALLISSIGSADLAGLEVLPMASVLIGGTLIICLGALIVRPQLAIAGGAFVSSFQGMTRPNTYLGLSTAAALYGDAGIALVAICIIAVIPLVNFLAVIAHLRWAGETEIRAQEPIPWRSALSNAIRNPVIVGCLIGAMLNLSGIGLPPLIGPFLILIGKAALPLGLMAVGAGLDLTTLRQQRHVLAWTAAVKLLVLPFITWTLCVMFGIEGVSLAVCVLFSALPVSATSYVIARQMGGDAQLMAGIVTATTLLSALTLPLVALIFL